MNKFFGLEEIKDYVWANTQAPKEKKERGECLLCNGKKDNFEYERFIRYDPTTEVCVCFRFFIISFLL